MLCKYCPYAQKDDFIIPGDNLIHTTAIRRAEKFMRENISRPLSLPEISKIAKLSPTFFSSVFKKETGVSLIDFLTTLRIKKAKSLLIETDESIGKVSSLCGYRDFPWFSKMFKRLTGMTPTAYRRKYAGLPRDLCSE